MLIAMGDESGVSSEDNYFSMAVYVASHDEWKRFDGRWRNALREHGLDYFHMWQFPRSRGMFKGWVEDRKKALMGDLLLAIASEPLKAYGTCMKVSDFWKLSARAQEGFVGPYMVCFYELTYGMSLETVGENPIVGLDFVYSLQDEYRKMMRRWWRWAKEKKDYGPRLGTLSFADMRTTPGLQAADLLAWELRHFYHLKETRPDLPIRFPLKMLLEHQSWMDANTLKYLPRWYLESQASQIHNAIMRVVFDDVEEWEQMFRQLGPGADELLKQMRLIKISDKYISFKNPTEARPIE